MTRDVIAGLICSLLSIAYCLSYAALIFSGPLSQWLSYGIAITFLSAAVSAAIYALRSSIPFAIASPDTSTAALMASLVAAMAARLAHEGHGDLLPAILVGVSLTTAATGIVLYALGKLKAGRAIRFVPFPVIGGFLGATGCLMVAGAVQVVVDVRLNLSNLAALAQMHVLLKLAAAVGLACVLHVLINRWRNAYVLPFLILAVMVSFHAAVSIIGASVEDAQTAGWVFPSVERVTPASPWMLWRDITAVPIKLLPWLAGDILAVIFVTTISLLLNATGVEVATRREVDVDRELRALGVSNVVGAAFGGYVSCLSLSRTTLAYASGAAGRLTGITVSIVCACFLLADPAYLAFVPKFALGGLLFFAGGRLIHRWLINSVSQLQIMDYLALLAIAAIIIQWGFIAGVVIGVVIGCATFALSASRVSAIKFSFNGSEYRSSLDRSPAELAILAEHGGELQGMALQSYLFFGSTSPLYEHVKSLITQSPECRFLLFDFRHVNGIDSSAIHNFIQIKDAARKIGARLVLVNLTPELQRMFRNNGLDQDGTILSDELDKAVEICETEIIAANWPNDQQSRTALAWVAEALGGAEAAERLLRVCRRLEIGPNQEIARQGDPSDSMHFIIEGRIAIFVALDENRSVRVRSLGRHTIIGEMGLVTGRPRSATIRTEASSVLYELPMEAYERINREDPALGQALHRFVIVAISERLSFANRMIGALQR